MTEQPALQIALPVDAIRAYCQKWNIRELALFGSVLRDDFDDESDIDVLVQFREAAHYTLFNLVTMAGELEAILGRKVDLLTRKGVEESPNYIRRQSILRSAQVIYAE
jgi:predicted nucleotidyltransferase